MLNQKKSSSVNRVSRILCVLKKKFFFENFENFRPGFDSDLQVAGIFENFEIFDIFEKSEYSEYSEYLGCSGTSECLEFPDHSEISEHSECSECSEHAENCQSISCTRSWSLFSA